MADRQGRRVRADLEQDARLGVFGPDPDGLVTVLVRPREVARRLRDENLAAVPDRCDARRAVHVDADVSLLSHERLAGVHTHAHTDCAAGQTVLPVGRGGEGVGRLRERDEERIALRVDLDTRVACERVTEDAPVCGERSRVIVAEVVQQPRRSLDVREEERDCPRRQRHG